MTYSLFCLGNPLLDMQVTNGEELLKKYDLKADNAILAGPEHAPIYDEILKDYKVTFVAGGASQNAARGAAYILPPHSVVYTGCVGNDELKDQLRAANKREGLDDVYFVRDGDQTGACAVILTGLNRSLVTTLRAAEKFEKEYLESPQIAPLLENAKFFYVEGFFLTHGTDCATYIAKKASEAGKVFALNLSAPFIPQFFKVQLEQVLPYTDLLIGNESEAESWATASGVPLASPSTTDTELSPETARLLSIAQTLAAFPKSNPSRPRMVVITQGASSTVLATSDGKTKVFNVNPLDNSQIVDTNGAGDAFAGGVLGSLVAGKSIDEAIEVGHKMGAMCVQLVGPQYKWPKVQVL